MNAPLSTATLQNPGRIANLQQLHHLVSQGTHVPIWAHKNLAAQILAQHGHNNMAVAHPGVMSQPQGYARGGVIGNQQQGNNEDMPPGMTDHPSGWGQPGMPGSDNIGNVAGQQQQQGQNQQMGNNVGNMGQQGQQRNIVTGSPGAGTSGGLLTGGSSRGHEGDGHHSTGGTGNPNMQAYYQAWLANPTNQPMVSSWQAQHPGVALPSWPLHYADGGLVKGNGGMSSLKVPGNRRYAEGGVVATGDNSGNMSDAEWEKLVKAGKIDENLSARMRAGNTLYPGNYLSRSLSDPESDVFRKKHPELFGYAKGGVIANQDTKRLSGKVKKKKS